MEGSAKIISLIARDENQHLAITQNILNNWRKGDDPEMVEIVKEEENWLIQAFKNTVDEEKRWAEYLFKDGSMIGLNDKLLQQYVEWVANRRIRAIGLKPIYDIPAKNNPLPWTEHWISSKGLQVAPQETEVESYIVGGIKQDVKKIPLVDLSYKNINLFPIPIHQFDVNGFSEFQDKLIDYAYDCKKKDPKGVSISNRGGWQSKGF